MNPTMMDVFVRQFQFVMRKSWPWRIWIRRLGMLVCSVSQRCMTLSGEVLSFLNSVMTTLSRHRRVLMMPLHLRVEFLMHWYTGRVFRRGFGRILRLRRRPGLRLRRLVLLLSGLLGIACRVGRRLTTLSTLVVAGTISVCRSRLGPLILRAGRSARLIMRFLAA